MRIYFTAFFDFCESKGAVKANPHFDTLRKVLLDSTEEIIGIFYPRIYVDKTL